jgi:hypothetical protein
MRSSGSVLIVVLGLLAILAIVGITFVTMSSLDRNTATNFAIQSQFILAADGAVDYVCHHLVQDLWEYTPSTGTYKDRLLTDANSTAGLVRNEPYDFPGPEDPWLATAVDVENLPKAPTAQRSYDLAVTGTPFGLDQWGSSRTPSGECPNNLGFPASNRKVSMYTQGDGHAAWIPDLSFPFETGLIRVSVTVQDHNAMINLNAHGNTITEKYRLGYFTSDVYPDSLGFSVQKLVENLDPPGLWKEVGKPGNLNQLAAVIENPGKFRDRVFTLDEEFKLRRLTGSLFKSRLEEFAKGTLESDPENASPAKATTRASCTTVSWTSQVRPDLQDGVPTVYTTNVPYSPRKVDLNLDKADAIAGALKDGYVFNKEDVFLMGQLAANVAGFRNGDAGQGVKLYYSTFVGASAQALISKIEATRGSSGSQGVEWSIKVQLVSPWPRNTPVENPSVGLSLNGVTLNVAGASTTITLPATMPLEASALSPDPKVFDFKVTVGSGQTLAGILRSITLNCAGKIIDEVDQLCLTELEQKKKYYRKIGLEDEKRYDGDQRPVRVVYIGIWEEGLNGTIDNFVKSAKPEGGIPIRFPRSVPTATTAIPTKGLPPFLMADENGKPILAYKSFARLGDLNQVLCPKDETEAKTFWPWTTRVAKASGLTSEKLLKFHWEDAPVPDKAIVTRLNAANVFTVGGPWNDRIDNDGDGFADEDGPTGFYGSDEGAESRGQFGGPEIRAAGMINLNTATLATLQVLESGFGLPNLANTVLAQRPLKSPAQILRGYSGTKVGDEAMGALEERELLYARISNVATVRSDTFSIYGTVQYIDTTLMARASTKLDRERAVRRNRRFWALVDRSPSLAYNPTSVEFTRPRILNFQWLD